LPTSRQADIRRGLGMPSATTPSALCVAWLVLCSPYFVSGAGGGDTTRVDDDNVGGMAGVVSVGTDVGIGGVGGGAGRRHRRPPPWERPHAEATAGSSTLHAMPTVNMRRLGEASEAARSVWPCTRAVAGTRSGVPR